jgi:peptidylprolyl isomerase
MQAPARVQNESKVRVLCKLSSLENNETIIDEMTTPVDIHLGEDDLIVGFYVALLGMKPGEKKTLNLNPIEGYGDYHKELRHKVKRSEIVSDIKAEVGNVFLIQHEDQSVPAVIIEAAKDTITIDTNHPFAGHRLRLELELVDII